MATIHPALPARSEEVSSLTVDESAMIFERTVQRYLKMSTSEFLSRLDSGYFQKHPELERRLDSVLFYLPLIKR
jgi:hypothetical protein